MPQIRSVRLIMGRAAEKLYRLQKNRAVVCVEKTLLAAAAGVLFSAAGMGGRPLPLCCALMSALDFCLPCVGCFLGAAAGSCWFWGIDLALEPLAAGFLVLAGLCLFDGLVPEGQKWFLPACTASLYLLVGMIFLLDASQTPPDVLLFLIRLALVFFCSGLFRDALKNRSAAGCAALFLAVLASCGRFRLSGGCAVSLFLAGMAVAASARQDACLLCAALCAVTLDLTAQPPVCMTAILCPAALALHALPAPRRWMDAAAFCLAALTAMLLLSQTDGTAWLMLSLGGALSPALPVRLLRRLLYPDTAHSVRAATQLELAAGQMSRVSRLLSRNVRTELQPQSAAVFDSAAEQICRDCARWRLCWDLCAAETYRSLSGAARYILRRGLAVPEDLPRSFLLRCCHAESFLAAVNDALDTQLARLQYQMRLAETRTVVSDQFHYISTFLTALAEKEPLPPPVPGYQPELGFRAQGIRGNVISGDHGASFCCGEWYYLLLCDGMGTGAEAAGEAECAVELLRGMIESGFDAQDCLRMLNGIYILRADGGFSTVDLLQISLVSAEGYLHKWGAAASYLLCGGEVKKIGTVLPPPGLGVGEAHQPDCVRLSMKNGEILVLLSDGIGSGEAEEYLSHCGELPPGEMADALCAGSGGAEPDDRTVAVVYLRPCPAQSSTGAKRTRIVSKIRA